MHEVQLREAKAKLSALVEAAERGEPTTITKHGRPAAMIVPVAEGVRRQKDRKPNFAEWLLSIPGELPVERDQTPPRVVEF